MKQMKLFGGVLALSLALLPCAARAATLSLGEASLSGDQLTVPVSVSGSSGGTLALYIGEAGPKDGEPVATTSAAAVEIPADGSYNITAQISVGAKIAYKAVLGSDESESGTITATDNVQYIWVNDAKGLWSDPANWTRDSSDGYKNIGYPAYSTGNIRFLGNQTAEVTLDADYEGYGDLKIDNPNLKLTIKGTGHALDTGNSACADSSEVILDNVFVTIRGNYHIKNNSSLKLFNGARFNVALWELAVEGANSLLYVGPGCEVDVDNWHRISLDGDGARIVIDDGYVHCYYFRIGYSKTDTPYGIVFKGSNPRLRPKFGMAIEKEIGTGSVLEFFVPRGGYESAPIYLIEGGNGPFLGNDASSSSMEVKIAPKSPFYQDIVASEVCLVDWARNTHIVNSGLVTFGTFENPDDNLYYTYKNDDTSMPNKIWAHLVGTGAAANTSEIDSAITVAVDAANAQVTATGTVAELGDGTTKAVLYIDEVEPNGTVRTVRAAEQVVSELGDVVLTGSVTLGVEVRSSIILENAQGDKIYKSYSSTNKTAVANNMTFKWVANASGLWSDPDNWVLEGDAPTDGLPRLNYPTRGCKARFYGGQTDTVLVDGDYTDISELQLGWDWADLTFVGTVDGAALHANGFKDMGTSNVTNRFDGVKLYGTSYHIVRNSALKLVNGGAMSMLFEVALAGENASMYVGTNCVVSVSTKEDWYRLELSGKDAEIVLDGGVIDALYLTIGAQHSEYLPKGITFKGKSAQLRLSDVNGERPSLVANAIPGSPVFNFIIPQGGYDATPILRTGGSGNTLFAQSSDDIPAVEFRVDPASPYLKVRGDFDQQLLDWSTSSADTKLNTSGVALADMRRAGEGLYFTPKGDSGKDGIAAHCVGTKAFTIIIR